MPELQRYTYPRDLTLEEASYFLTVLKRKFLFSNAQITGLCCHSKDRNFLGSHDSLFRCYDIIRKEMSVLLQSLYKNMWIIAEDNPELEFLFRNFIKMVQFISYNSVLILCSWYLIEYHEKSECSEYLSLALKLYLKVFQVKSLQYPFHMYPDANMKNMISYLKFIRENNCRSEVFRGYLDFFLDSFLRGHLEEDVLFVGLRNVFEIAHEFRFNLFVGIFEDKKFKNYTRQLILLNLKVFLVLVKYGHEDKCQEGSVRDYMTAISKVNTDTSDIVGCIRVSNAEEEGIGYQYRTLQVLYLYVKSVYDDENRDMIYEETLRVVWNATPDSFLIENEFLSCFCSFSLNIEHVNKNLRGAWKWYEQSVLNEVSVHEKSPRTLKHLSRCAIRRRLTACVQLPFGVQTLDIPETLKSYLRLNY